MAELQVDTAALKARAGHFREAAAGHRQVAAADAATVESDIAALGEINATLHDLWRATKEAQSEAWSALGAAHDDHSDKLIETANGYDGADIVNAESLRTQL